jgi:hypothetical protein
MLGGLENARGKGGCGSLPEQTKHLLKFMSLFLSVRVHKDMTHKGWARNTLNRSGTGRSCTSHLVILAAHIKVSDDITNVTRARGPIATTAYEVECNPNQESQSSTCLLRL